jgi:hypothetical protein
MERASGVLSGGFKVMGNPRNTVADHMFRDKIAHELGRKGVLPYAVFDFVNSEAMYLALAFRNPSFCAWVTKHVTGKYAVGRKMFCWKLWDTDACACCGQADEKTTHIALCENVDMMTAYKAAVDDFSAWMASATQTCASLPISLPCFPANLSFQRTMNTTTNGCQSK